MRSNDSALQPVLETHKAQEALLNAELYKAKSNTSYSFQELWEKESFRVANVVQEQQEGMEITLKALLVRAQIVATATTDPSWNNQRIHDQLQEIRHGVRTIVEESIQLQNFLTFNRSALSNIAAAADKRLGTRMSPMVEHCFPKKHLNTALVCVVSDVYNAVRQGEEALKSNSGAGDVVWQAPSSFQRNTTKYWVKDEDLTALLMACASEAPLLVYGKKGPLTSTATPHDLQTSEGDKLWDTLATRITSIYFDSADMELYKHRLARAEGAQLLRARWYGPTMPVGERIIFLELKTHHERWVAQKSVKERASIQERDMVNFLNPVAWTKEDAQEMLLRATPTLEGKDLAKASNLLLRMHNLVVKHKLTACVRSVYYRAAFQSSSSNDLRLTLDRTVTLVNERVERSKPDQWCLSDEEAPSAQAKLVPFNVFEVKLAGDDPMPPALQDSLDIGVIQLAAKFSKFTSGAAAFNKVSTLPYWAAFPAFQSFFALALQVRPSSKVQQNNSVADNDYNLMTSSDQEVVVTPLPGVTIAPMKIARVEPKTFFAHERTFVQWISASILLLSVSGFLLQTGRFDVTAGVIALSSMFLVIYSTYLYFKRLSLLKIRQPDGYFNKFSPRLLTGLVGLAIFLIWLDSFKAGDVLDFFVSEPDDGRRLMLSETMDGRRNLIEGFQKCSLDEAGTRVSVEEKLSSFVLLDTMKDDFLSTSGDSIYSLSLKADASAMTRLAQVPRSDLQGLAMVHERIFAVSGGPDGTELVEMAWWGTSARNQGLRQIRRWTLLESPSDIDGFTFVPNSKESSGGAFYISIDSSIHAYTVPEMAKEDHDSIESKPRRLKSLNMKVLRKSSSFPHDDYNLSSIVFFEDAVYILLPERNVIQAWNMTNGELLGEIEIPTSDDNEKELKWKGFALERMIAAGDKKANLDTPSLRGSILAEDGPSTEVVLHLLSESSLGRDIWTFSLMGCS